MRGQAAKYVEGGALTLNRITEPILQQMVERISIESFGKPFRHRATFNARLKTTGGRYLLRSHNIEINPKQWEAHGEEEVIRIIKHELCHYHLHIEGKGYQHRDKDFKQLLQKVGGSRFCKAIPSLQKNRREPYRYRLVCKACGLTYLRKRRVDVRKYVCGRCRGSLLMERLAVETGTSKNLK
ncbi:SprT family protein [Paenibacillus assamensis]|uniref:SprT family protein n=1 Tax=Paenibacillus assamensis TaxID=311244 RepID=UPI0003F884CA|nr:SprT family protein [Paenibacillus assamensis]